MKPALKISLVLNLGWLVCLFVLLAGKKPLSARSLKTQPNRTAEWVQPSAEVAPDRKQAESKPFRWDQLESSDYRVYIANLRAIGCPEQTTRDIITADLDALYAPRREELSGRLTRSERSPAPGLVPGTLAAQLQQLSEEEGTLLSALLGPPPAANQLAASAQTPSRAPRKRATNASVTMPLVFQNVDPGTLKLDSNRLAVIADLRQTFLGRIGESNQDPNDPQYRERWQQAQPEIDEMLKAEIGINAYLEYQVQAAPGSEVSAESP